MIAFNPIMTGNHHSKIGRERVKADNADRDVARVEENIRQIILVRAEAKAAAMTRG